MSTAPARTRWAAVFALLIVLATALFVVGVAVERNQGHTEAAPSSTESDEHSEGEPGEGSHSEEGEGTTSGNEADSEKILGVDTERTAVVTVAVLIALCLAAAIWWRPRRDVLMVAVAFCLGATALDVRELLHQLHENRDAVAALAAAVALLHLAAAGAGGAALRSTMGGSSGSLPDTIAP